AAGVLLTGGAVDRAVLEQIVAGSGGRIHIALENCPNQTVLFGERDDIDPVAARLKEQGAICVPLAFERGYHTPLIAEADPILRTLDESLDIGPARHAALQLHDGRVVPGRTGGDPRAGDAADLQSGAVPAGDRESLCERRADLHRGGARGQSDGVRPRHAAAAAAPCSAVEHGG